MMQPLWISKDPCITEEKGKMFKWEGGGVGVWEPGFWRFEDCKYSLGKMEAGREFQFLEVIETNILANEVVRHFNIELI